MQWVGVPELAAAVASAGAVGMLTALTQPSPEALREAIRKTNSMTKGRFVGGQPRCANSRVSTSHSYQVLTRLTSAYET